jgi:hypothetical protein
MIAPVNILDRLAVAGMARHRPQGSQFALVGRCQHSHRFQRFLDDRQLPALAWSANVVAWLVAVTFLTRGCFHYVQP